MAARQTILVFDSGLGGLTVYREVAAARPDAASSTPCMIGYRGVFSTPLAQSCNATCRRASQATSFRLKSRSASMRVRR